MVKTIICSKEAPAPVGPYNQAVQTGHLVFLAGQIPLEPESGKIEADNITDQTHRVIKNIQAVLKESGATLDAVVKTTVFLKDLNDFSAMNEVYASYFNEESAPARSTIQVAKLPLDSLVEIEVVAEVSS